MAAARRALCRALGVQACPAMGRLLMLVIIAAVIGWTIHQAQVRRAQRRLRQLGERLEARGSGFQAWLTAAGLQPGDLHDRRRRDEVQARLEHAASDLLRG